MKTLKQFLKESSRRSIAKRAGYEVFSVDSNKDGGYIEVTYNGKVVAKGDYDSGSDSFWISIPGANGQKSFNEADDIIKALISKGIK